jgi:hypothetical protein
MFRSTPRYVWLAGPALLALACLRAPQPEPTRSAPLSSQSTPASSAPAAPEPPRAPIADASAPHAGQTILVEAESFSVKSPGWEARPYGTNYYAATFANTFLSRKAYLGAPENGPPSVASADVSIPEAGRYLALVRYEAAFRFQTQFRLRIEQRGKIKLDRLYGSLDNVKIHAFGMGLQKDVAWAWGAVENIVWEGHDAAVDLDAGPARLVLVAGEQPDPAARRNVDLVMLTTDAADVARRIEKEHYLPLDGLLTQAGDVFLRVHARKESAPLTIKINNGTEHSPYWVHMREWKPKTLQIASAESTDWVEVGSLLDTLNDGQWPIAASGKGPISFDLEIAVRSPAGKIDPIRRFDGLTGSVLLAYDADTRGTRRIRLAEEVIYELVSYLEKQPVHGVAPSRTLVFGYTFERQPGNARLDAAITRFIDLMGATAIGPGLPGDEHATAARRRGYVDVRNVAPAKLASYCAELKREGKADSIAVVSLGDEIGLEAPPPGDDAGLRAFLKEQKVAPGEIDPAARDLGAISYSPTPETAKTNPRLYYYSKLYSYRFGETVLHERTRAVQRCLPEAEVGANYSPHDGHYYVGSTHKWISLFRAGAMTMPWSEDYVFQVPVASPQVNLLAVDTLRAGIRGRPGAKLHYYVLAHSPGNTTDDWRRLFYGAIAHGVTILNLYELRPVQAAFTENHVDAPEMYQTVRQAIFELGQFEDVVQDGHVRPGVVALFRSEAADVWDDDAAPFDAGKRALYLAIRQQQLPLDVVVEGDRLAGYKVLYLADRHVKASAARAIAEWVKRGGHLVATAGAGMLDEFDQPSAVMRELIGIEPGEIAIDEKPLIRFEKQDLPFASVIDNVHVGEQLPIPVVGARGRFRTSDASVLGRFDDGSPAVTRRTVGRGSASYLGFLPGLSYLRPAIPKRPVDRSSASGSMSHLLPTEVDGRAARLLLPGDVRGPIECSDPLVETTMIESKHGALIPLVNWRPGSIHGLTVSVRVDVPTSDVRLASGRPVKVRRESDRTVFEIDLDVADALILR